MFSLTEAPGFCPGFSTVWTCLLISFSSCLVAWSSIQLRCPIIKCIRIFILWLRHLAGYNTTGILRKWKKNENVHLVENCVIEESPLRNGLMAQAFSCAEIPSFLEYFTLPIFPQTCPGLLQFFIASVHWEAFSYQLWVRPLFRRSLAPVAAVSQPLRVQILTKGMEIMFIEWRIRQPNLVNMVLRNLA